MPELYDLPATHTCYHYDQLPNMVIDGFSLPLLLNNGRLSILAKGLFGFGSHGVPSTRDQAPIFEFLPTTLYMTCASRF